MLSIAFFGIQEPDKTLEFHKKPPHKICLLIFCEFQLLFCCNIFKISVIALKFLLSIYLGCLNCTYYKVFCDLFLTLASRILFTLNFSKTSQTGFFSLYRRINQGLQINSFRYLFVRFCKMSVKCKKKYIYATIFVTIFFRTGSYSLTCTFAL